MAAVKPEGRVSDRLRIAEIAIRLFTSSDPLDSAQLTSSQRPVRSLATTGSRGIASRRDAAFNAVRDGSDWIAYFDVSTNEQRPARIQRKP